MKKIIPLVLLMALMLLLSSCLFKNQNTAGPSPSGAATDDFVFTRDNFPKMDGSTSTIPLGQAIASVLLGKTRQQVADLAQFNKTTQSYRNLMNGDADIVIAAEPNADVFQEMKDAGFTYEMTPIATDALIFVVNANNPVSNLTTEQVRKIYSGEITNWKQVGGSDAKIEAFQRNAESGSQALMEKLVMKDLKMAEAPKGYMISEMEGLMTGVKSFDGSSSAIGYSVYYYANDMKMADGLKILSIDGVSPSDETIAAKQYPFLNPYYVAIASDEPEKSPARVLYNWLLSPEGQHLIKTEGYVPVSG
ncbi:substrate-binding domain-containing protein [Oscillospiraceae bacterium WX1]